MKLTFSKYHGTGNDFIMIDARELSADWSEMRVSTLCDRRFGIGGDGLILLTHAVGYDFRMIYFNADGKEGSMCGNGGRCVAAFARQLGFIGERFEFIGADGPHQAIMLEGARVKLKMKDVTSQQDVGGFHFLDTGSPHVVMMVESLDRFNVYETGKSIRQNASFSPAGTNVNFVQPENDGLFVRTFERGVEAETFSCGTGVTASALMAFKAGWISHDSTCQVRTPGGLLTVHFRSTDRGFEDVWLEGPTCHVYDGTIEL